MTCPKCGSLNITGAPDEAPPWATSWTKCFACGKRWNLNGGPPEKTGEDDDTEELEVRPTLKRTGEDIVKLVMDLSRQRKPGPKARPIETKEMTMRPRCTNGSCEDESAEDSVRCPKHRDQQRAHNEKFQGRTRLDAGTPKRKYTRRTPLGTASTAAATMLATRSPAPITLAEPTIVNATSARAMDLNGNAITVLESFIEKLQADLTTLREAKEIIERHG